MRGLTRALDKGVGAASAGGPDRGRPRGLTRGLSRSTGAAAASVAAAGLLLAGCATDVEGVRIEGPARTESPTKAPTSDIGSSPAPTKVDAVALLKKDPRVSVEIRRDLKPCGAGREYPVDISYGNLTGSSAPDVVVNVLTCADAVGVGTYVYRREGGGHYTDVFANEQPPVYAEIDRGDLVVTRQVYGPGDSVTYPSGEDVITYRWSGGKFVEHSRTHSDYSKAVNGAQPTADPEG